MPSPGRSSCEIRVSPDPVHTIRALSRSTTGPSPATRPGDRSTMTTPTLPPPDRRPADAGPPIGRAHHRDGLSQLRAGTAARRSSYVCPACFGPLEVTYDLRVSSRATLTRDAIAVATARASGATSSCCRSRRPRCARCRSAPLPCSQPTDSAPVLEVERLWIKDDTRNPSLSFNYLRCRGGSRARGRVRRPGPRLRLDRQSRRATAASAAAVGRPAYVFIPADLERDKSTTRSPTARRSCRSTAPTTT